MIAYQQQRQQVIQLFQAAITMAKKLRNQEVEKRLNESAHHFIQGKLLVVVCGEFKQGKSSLINAFLNEKDLFPVDIDVTTSIVSSITYGPTEKISVVLGESGKEREQQITRTQIQDYVTEQRNKQNSRQARLLSIEAPNEQLKDGLTLVDTPGVGGLNIRHSEVTHTFLHNADVVLFVSDAFRPLSTQDLQFISERVVPYCQNMLFVVTKIDSKRDYQVVVEENRQKLAQALNRTGDTMLIIPVSSRAKLTYLQSRDDEDLEDSHFMALENEIWKLLRDQRVRILLAGALSALGEAVMEMERPLQLEWETYQQQNAQQVQEMENQFREASQRLKKLLEKNAQWVTHLGDRIADIRSGVTKEFQDGFVLIRRQLDRYLDDDTMRESPDRLINQVQIDIDGLMALLSKHIEQTAGKLYADLNEEIECSIELRLNSLDLVPSFTERSVTLPSWKSPHQTQQTATWYQTGGSWDKLVTIARSAKLAGSGGSMVGRIVGGILGGIIGFVAGGIGILPGAGLGSMIGGGLGQLAGMGNGLQKEMEQQRGKQKAEILKMVTPFLDDCQRECSHILNEALKKTERTLRDELRSQIQREQQTCEKTLQTIQDARKLTQEQAARRVAELKVPLDTLSRIRKSIEDQARLTVEPETEGPRRSVAAAPGSPRKGAMSPGAHSGSFADEDE